MKKVYMFLITLFLYNGASFAQNLFNQDFSTSNTVTDYFSSSSPTANLLNSISAFGTTQPSINNNALKWEKTNGTTGGSSALLIRNTPISSDNISFLKFQFKVKLSYLNNNAGTVGFNVYIGNGATSTGWTNLSSTAAPTDNELFTKFDFVVETKDAPDNTVRYRIGSSSPEVWSGLNDWGEVTIFCNKSSAAVNYMGMNGSSTNLNANAIDVWFGTTRVRAGVGATTSTVNPSMFKMVFPSQMHSMNIEVDHIKIWDQSVLPVSLTGFSGKVYGDAVKLQWQTASEKNNSHFEVLRSSDGKSFQSITTVKGHGDSNQLIDYQYIDNSPVSGTNYYKLKQYDNDGKWEEFTQVLVVNYNLNANKLIASYANGILKLNYQSTGQQLKLTLTDITGKIVLNRKLNVTGNDSEVPVNLQKGVYVVTVEDGSQQSSSVKLLN
ncbi:T9SS type A sorting domain-containing protein [Pseudopedobacter beijingensis]|uniref:T9SS type A sorting domain-containing protein n=1 Tax=Pseudopedobacter beijingensis TaxID=1207056 RepID=A0ABW4I866_9SPHI